MYSDWEILGNVIRDIEWRADELNELNLVCAVYVNKLSSLLREVQTRSAALAVFAHSNWELMKKAANVPALELELLSIETLTTQVSHRLGSFETELWLAIDGYRAERTKARNDWLTLAHLYNDLRPRQLAILRSSGVDVSANRRAFVIWEQGVSDLQDPPSQPEAGAARSSEQDPAQRPEIRSE